jgi:spore coat polysaccharide biosynthesis protein SpsF
MENRKTNPVAVIQARMGSSRLPGKVLEEIAGQPMLWHIVERVRRADCLSNVVIATSVLPGDEPIRRFCAEEQIPFFAGSEQDVLDRFYRASQRFGADPIFRITGDCPFVDPAVLENLSVLFFSGEYDHVGVAAGAGALFVREGRFPHGLDAECFSFSALERSWREATDVSDREHVTPFMWRVAGRFRNGTLRSNKDYSDLRWTVDYEEDLRVVRQIYEHLYPMNPEFGLNDILEYLKEHPTLMAINRCRSGQSQFRAAWFPQESRPDSAAKSLAKQGRRNHV